ncbi:TPA: hypothetical protein RQO19_005480 [Klebsiella michiganensis]|nr:hypothetical protein [Klebsiella michiganensis]
MLKHLNVTHTRDPSEHDTDTGVRDHGEQPSVLGMSHNRLLPKAEEICIRTEIYQTPLSDIALDSVECVNVGPLLRLLFLRNPDTIKHHSECRIHNIRARPFPEPFSITEFGILAHRENRHDNSTLNLFYHFTVIKYKNYIITDFSYYSVFIKKVEFFYTLPPCGNLKSRPWEKHTIHYQEAGYHKIRESSM